MDRSMKVGMLSFTFLLFLFAIHDTIEATIEAIKTHYNDIYDCVDFYKQPAFDHPLLANHTFHRAMRPSKMRIFETKVSNNNIEVQFKGKGCPIGTVPIRRIKENDFVKYGSKYNAANPGTHYAIARTKSNPAKKYNGGAARFSIWNPSVEKSQYSSSQLVIRNGDDNIQVGWTVNPSLFGDTRTRLFIYTGAGSTQCFNTDCSGFVVTSTDIFLGSVIEYVSKKGGPISSLRLMIHKDEKNGNWWLGLGPSFKPIGFWPKKIFTNLADMATSVIFGGQVYSPPNVPSPPMGSGGFLERNTNDAFCSMISVLNETYKEVDAVDIETFSDNSRYQVVFMEAKEKSFGKIVLFGGPGGITGNSP